jgi:hypothetical protein
MQSKEMLKHMFDINKSTYENVLKSMNVLQEQTEKMINLLGGRHA